LANSQNKVRRITVSERRSWIWQVYEKGIKIKKERKKKKGVENVKMKCKYMI
jgi:hypothetical protein